MQKNTGFSLVEVLITLSILGIVGMFTVPKILNPPNSSKSSKQSAMAKDVAYMIFNAYQQYQSATSTVPTNLVPSNLTPYMNFVRLDTSSAIIDGLPGFTTRTCRSITPCIRLHNGGALWLQDNLSFGGNTTINMIEFSFDPDGVYSGSSADGPGKAVQFTLYYDGSMRTRGKIKLGSCDNVGCTALPDDSLDPSWFTGF